MLDHIPLTVADKRRSEEAQAAQIGMLRRAKANSRIVLRPSREVLAEALEEYGTWAGVARAFGIHEGLVGRFGREYGLSPDPKRARAASRTSRGRRAGYFVPEDILHRSAAWCAAYREAKAFGADMWGATRWADTMMVEAAERRPGGAR